MKTFLQLVAEDLKERFASDFSHVTVVFPNKRASLFLNEELLSLADGPVWAPRYKTIGELFGGISDSIVADKIQVISHLYKIYREELPLETETMDQFWGWGEIMLSDFDDIDKHLVDAKKLFKNAEELKALEDASFLDDEQEEALRQFFSNFSKEGLTKIQERFMALWNVMYKIYTRIQDEMPVGVFPWEGAQLRHVVEHKEYLANIDADTTFVFVGFNMLGETEKKLMKYLRDRKRALFYWDYDNLYASKENKRFEAGDFMRENLVMFPNAFCNRYSDSEIHEMFDNISKKGELTFISTSTDSIQTRYIPSWLSIYLGDKERETAIVLCDENQLMPVLHSIPTKDNEDGFKSPKEINITMGYPLRGTPVFSFITGLLRLQTEGYDERRNRFRRSFEKLVESHPFSRLMERELWHKAIDSHNVVELIDYLDSVLLELPVKSDSEENDDILYTESIFLVHKTLQQFRALFTDSEHPLELQTITFRRLFRKVLAGESIPFHGEPATGIQVMGVLETRCIDFKNILMLNVGEGLFPKTSADTSLIPNTLRMGFKLTVQRHKIAVFAYYFYRLLQRSENVTFIYNENSSGITKHEMSRFLRQVQAETDIPIHYVRLQANQKVEHNEREDVAKTPEIMLKLHELFDIDTNPNAGSLTPTAINHYLDCPMRFYLSDICKVHVSEDKEETVDAPTMGSIFHEAARRLYEDLNIRSTNGCITREMLSEYTKDKAKNLQPYIDKAFNDVAEITEYRGENILIRNVIEKYLLNLLRFDMEICPIKIKVLEKYKSTILKVCLNDGRQISIKTGGQIDRMDIVRNKDGKDIFRIVDYKTGSHVNDVSDMKNLFTRDSNHAGYYLQTFLYSLAAIRQDRITASVKPVLFYANLAGTKDYDPTLHIGTKSSKMAIENFQDILSDYESGLKDVIREIFEPEGCFTKASSDASCKFCDFKKICNKQS